MRAVMVSRERRAIRASTCRCKWRGGARRQVLGWGASGHILSAGGMQGKGGKHLPLQGEGRRGRYWGGVYSSVVEGQCDALGSEGEHLRLQGEAEGR